jgi:hypothetical protein
LSNLRMPTPARAILLTGLIAGVLDITAAFVFSALRGAGPARVLRFVASGLLGAAAARGGAATAALGLALHFVIATGWAAVYWAASRKIAFLRTHPVPAGLLYGIAVYFLMNLVVVPLSAVPPRPFVPSPGMIGIHMFCVGLPIALALRHLARDPGGRSRAISSHARSEEHDD